MHHLINNILPFLVLEDGSADKPLELIDVIANNITEYHNLRKIKLLLSKRIDQAHSINICEWSIIEMKLLMFQLVLIMD